jgi:hypothetical protein
MKLEKEITKKKSEPIQASMENSWPESWDQAILIEKKNREAQSLINSMLKAEIKKENQCKRNKNKRPMSIRVNISYKWPGSLDWDHHIEKRYEAQFLTIQYWRMKLKKKGSKAKKIKRIRTKFEIKIKWCKSLESIQISMENPWHGSWYRVIIIESKT